MGLDKISKAIKISCGEEKILNDMLQELLISTRSGKSWYKDTYKETLRKYARKEVENEN